MVKKPVTKNVCWFNISQTGNTYINYWLKKTLVCIAFFSRNVVMNPITALCDSYEVTALVGTEFILLFVCCLIEIFILCFTIYNICLGQNNKNVKKKITMLFRCLIVGYHSFVFIYLLLILILKIFLIFNISNVLDYAWDESCNILNFWSNLFIPAAYTTCIMFWFFRLMKIFNGTIYSFSQKKKKMIITVFLFVVFIGFSSMIIAIIMSYTTVKNSSNMYVFNNNNHDAFCKYKQHVIDFLPILQTSNDVSYKYHLNHFYGCTIKSTHISSYFVLFSKILTIIAVPSMNGFLFYHFVVKMSQYLKDTYKVNGKINRINDDQLFIKYLNVIIGISCVLTTLISISLTIVNRHFFLPLLYIDLILNGYFIVVIFQFGNKLLCKCCKNKIWRLVKIKRDKFRSVSTESSL